MATIDFDPPSRCVVGTVGPPGERTFFVQVSATARSAAVSIEKFHVTTLADRINDVLDRVAGAAASEAAAAWSPTTSTLISRTSGQHRPPPLG